MAVTSVIEALRDAGDVVAASEFRGDQRVVITAERILPVLQRLRLEFGFDMLVDLTCVDYLHYRAAPDRFGLVYSLLSTARNERLFVRAYLNESRLEVDSVVSQWEAANWLEREVYDLFGIRFRGHPDLRRILLPEAFAGHPLRKDYPLQGHGERHNFPVIRRGES